jgi:hypothetical protein
MNNKYSWQFRLFVVSAILLAWFVSIQEYIPLADDYYLARYPLWNLEEWFKIEGIWRILGIGLIGSALNSPQLFFPALIIAIHALNSLLFMEFLERIGIGGRTTLALSLVFGVFPFSFQSFLWMSGAIPVLTLTILMVFSIQIVNDVKGNSRRPILPGFVRFFIYCLIVLISLLLQENSIFALCVLPLIQPLHQIIQQRQISLDWVRFWPRMGIILGAILFIAAHKFIVPPGDPEVVNRLKEASFNLNALFSSIYYQHVHYRVFVPLFELPGYFVKLLDCLKWWHGLIFVVSVAGQVPGWLLLIRNQRHSSLEKSAVSRIDNTLVALFSILMLLGLSSVFVLSGGFSLDTRKFYLFIPFFLLTAGWATNFAGAYLGDGFSRLRRFFPPFLAGLLVLGVISTWQVVAIYREFALAGAQMAKALSLIPDDREFGFDLQSLPTAQVGYWKSFIGFDFQDKWVLDAALMNEHRRGMVRLMSKNKLSSGGIVLIWDQKSKNWIIEE